MSLRSTSASCVGVLNPDGGTLGRGDGLTEAQVRQQHLSALRQVSRAEWDAEVTTESGPEPTYGLGKQRAG